MKCIRVKLPFNSDYYNIKIDNEIDIKLRDEVIIEIEDYKCLYYVVVLDIVDNDCNIKFNGNYIRHISNEDKKLYNSQLKNFIAWKLKLKNLNEELKLEMNIVSVYESFDNKYLHVLYTADNRVDFREFLKNINSKYHRKIELKQIGVRDKAKIVSGLGICGQEQCCSRFKKKFDVINISMAKKQNIALNPNKINGNCGRLLCCLKYELENNNEEKNGSSE